MMRLTLLLVAVVLAAAIPYGIERRRLRREDALRRRRVGTAKCAHNVWVGTSLGFGVVCDDCGAPMPPEPVKKARG